MQTITYRQIGESMGTDNSPRSNDERKPERGTDSAEDEIGGDFEENIA
jgi:hypothetical protein